MPRKYINRSRKKSEKNSAEDEWAHIAEVEGLNLDVKDALDVQDRTILLRKEQEKSSTYDAAKEEARNAMDAAGNTCQYIRFVKMHIDDQKKEIDKIKQIKEKFDQEVKLLQSHTPKLSNLDSESLDKFDINTVTEYLQELLSEKGLTKKKLDELKNDINTVEDELKNQEWQIEGLNEELESKKTEEKIKNEESDIIKNELDSLVEKFGIENLASVLEKVKSGQTSKAP